MIPNKALEKFSGSLAFHSQVEHRNPDQLPEITGIILDELHPVILVAVPFVKVKSLEYMDWSLDSLNED